MNEWFFPDMGRLQEKNGDGEEDLTYQEVIKQMKQKEITLKEREAAKSQANGTETDIKLIVWQMNWLRFRNLKDPMTLEELERIHKETD